MFDGFAIDAYAYLRQEFWRCDREFQTGIGELIGAPEGGRCRSSGLNRVGWPIGEESGGGEDAYSRDNSHAEGMTF